jgi:hypothetical protein
VRDLCTLARRFATPRPPTQAPEPDDAMTPAPVSRAKMKPSKAEKREKDPSLKEGLVDDEGDDPEEGKAKKKKSKKKTKEIRPSDDDVDGFD